MTTLKEMVEACKHVAGLQRQSLNHLVSGAGDELFAAAATLTRDGELRERLARLVETWRTRVEAGSDAATWFMAADELSAILTKD